MTKISKRILSSAKKIIDDHKNSNLLLEILEHFQDEDDEINISCCTSAGKIFNHFTSKTNFLETETTKEGEEQELSKDEQFNRWLQEQYKTTCDLLYSHLVHDSTAVQISAIEALIMILGGISEGTSQSQACSDSRNEIVERIMTVSLDNDCNRVKLISQFPGLLLSCGEGQEVAMTCLTFVHKNIKQEKSQMSDAKAFNTWHIVSQIVNCGELDNKAKSLVNKIVLTFLKREVPTKLYKDILTGITPVMENMTSPLLLADFLTQAFNVGGAISLMSLNGLFTLMHKYNLNYPDFYDKLYSMFHPQIFGAKYRSRFFHLADLFLSSTHLPSYLVAAFVKKLARLCLHAPASGIQITVPFIFTLIHRHPACDVLLHRTEGNLEFESDPFLEDEPPAKCKALDSCVWELRTLENHFDPTISAQAKKRLIQEEEIGKYLDKSITDIMESESKKRKKDVPLTFEKWTNSSLFESFVP